MKKLGISLTMLLCSLSVFASGRSYYEIQTQIQCDLNNRLSIESLEILTGQRKVSSTIGRDGFPEIVTTDPGSLIINLSNGVTEVLKPISGRGGVFGEIKFPSVFFHENDAQRSTKLKFESPRLGVIQLSYICNEANSFYCDLRSGYESPEAIVNLNIKNTILNLNGRSLPVCTRTVLR